MLGDDGRQRRRLGRVDTHHRRGLGPETGDLALGRVGPRARRLELAPRPRRDRADEHGAALRHGESRRELNDSRIVHDVDRHEDGLRQPLRLDRRRLDPPGRVARDDARDEHRHEHDDERRVQEVGVEESDLDADRDRGERRRGLGEREAVEQASLWPFEPQDPSRESCRRCLSDEDDRERQARDRDHAHLGERRGIDEHPGRQEEEGDEQDASDELDLLHEPAPGGHQPIQGQPCEERAHDPLDPCAIGHECRRGERDDDEEEARAAVLADAGEHPAGGARKHESAEQREDHEPDDRPRGGRR